MIIKNNLNLEPSDAKSLNQLTFRDGYIFALADKGLYVWDGDLKEGTFI